MDRPNYIDRTAPRFGPHWVEFPIRSKATHEIVRLHKEEVPFSVTKDTAASHEDLVEMTRRHYMATMGTGHRLRSSMKARERREAARPSR